MTLQRPLRLATYNIHRCIGRDQQFSPKRISMVLQQLNADVIALQELETHEDFGLDILSWFAECTGLQPIPGPTMFNESGNYGNALLVPKQDITRIQLDISFSRREPRGIIGCEFVHAGQRLRILATHFGLKRRERLQQCRSALELIRELDLQSPQQYTNVLMGDLNEWWPWAQVLRQLGQLFDLKKGRRTFPSHLPLLALDKVLVETGRAQSKLFAVDTELTRVASDHLPLVADLTFE